MGLKLRGIKSPLAATLLALGLGSGCYEGVDETGGVPWGGISAEDTDGVAEDDEDDGNADADEGGDASDDGSDDGGPGGGSSSDGDPGGSDGTDSTGGDSGGSDGTDPTGGDPDPNPGGDDPTDGSQSSDVPDNGYCQNVAGWDPQWAALEDEILAIVNQRRAEGANCGSEGTFGPAGPLTMDPMLRCSSRVHSMDMAENNYFDHTNLDGESPFSRMQQAGYNYSTAGENIAGGNGTAAATMNQWMNSDGHCANIMNPNFEHLGVGYAPGGPYNHMWTQNFGAQ